MPYPTLDGAKLQSIREKVDAFFIDEVRRLEDAYYGTTLETDAEGHAVRRDVDGWRHDVSHPYTIGGRTFDKRTTVAGSKQLFDRVHGALWDLHTISLYFQNDEDGKPYGDIDTRTQEVLVSDDGTTVTYERQTVDLRAKVKALIKEAQAANIDLMEVIPLQLRQAVRDYLNA